MNNFNTVWQHSEPPVKQYNLCVNGTRVWSGDEWPPHGMVDAISMACKLTNAKFLFCYSDGSTFSY